MLEKKAGIKITQSKSDFVLMEKAWFRTSQATAANVRLWPNLYVLFHSPTDPIE